MAKCTKYRGRWVVRWRDLSGKQCMRRAPDKTTGDRLEREIERALALGRDWEPESARKAARVAEVMRLYIQERAQTYAGGTLLRTSESLEYAKACWGDILLEELTKAHLNQLWAWLRDAANSRKHKHGGHAGQRSLDTVAKHVQSVQTWWKWAAEDERFEDECPLPRRIQLKRDPAKLPSAPTWPQCDAMIAELRAEWHRRVAVLARYTGARASELFALDWRDVDLQERVIRWRPEITKGGYGGRIVPMPKGLAEELAGWGKREGQVVAATPRAKAHARDKFRNAWVRAGVPERVYERQPLHGFRKTIETELLAAGVRQQVIDCYLGHKPRGTGQKHYADTRWAWKPMLDAFECIPEITVPRAAGLEVV